MLEQTKSQVHKWKFLQHALSRYVYNRSLFVIYIDVQFEIIFHETVPRMRHALPVFAIYHKD